MRRHANQPKVSDEPIFTFERKQEAADSILSEGHDSDDEVFSSQTSSKINVPTLPDAQQKLHPPSGQPDSGSPILDLPPSEVPTLELRKPVDIVPPPAPSGTLLLPPTEPMPSVPAVPTPAPQANPFAFDPSGTHSTLAERPATLPESVPIPIPIEESSGEVAEKRTARGSRERDAAETGGKFKTLALVLAAYSLVVTALAVYGLFFKPTEKLDPGHPLSTIPDNFGEFDPATRKKVTQLKVDVDAPLPENLKAALSGKIEVGQLRIEPIGVESRKLVLFEEPKSGGTPGRTETRTPALVLNLRVKNTSPDLVVFPLDPAFNRRAAADKVGTQLVVGKQVFRGGPIPWPFPAGTKRRYEEKQEGDATPLRPGETRDYVVCTNYDPLILRAVKQSGDTLLWRVQVRRGVVALKGKDVPVTAIIGVEFKASDVKNLD